MDSLQAIDGMQQLVESLLSLVEDLGQGQLPRLRAEPLPAQATLRIEINCQGPERLLRQRPGPVEGACGPA
jgi:hypothetical protein